MYLRVTQQYLDKLLLVIVFKQISYSPDETPTATSKDNKQKRSKEDMISVENVL